MGKYKLSVLVTFYNQQEYVDKILASIFSQITKYDYEVIIGDDGSTDGTIEKVKAWKDNHSNISLYNFKREGTMIPGFRASKNRLFLLDKACGEYSLFLDGDDFICAKDKFEKQISILDKQNSCSSCAHNFYYYKSEENKKIGVKKDLKEGIIDEQYYWGNLYFHTDTLMFRTNIRDTFDHELIENQFNDNMITFLIIQDGPIYYLNEPMICYNLTGDGIWTGEKQIVSNIRNIYMYDICAKINPNFKKETRIKFYKSWQYLFINREAIDIKNLEYLDESINKHLIWSNKWISYKSLSYKDKYLLLCEYLNCMIMFQFFRIYKCIERMI